MKRSELEAMALEMSPTEYSKALFHFVERCSDDYLAHLANGGAPKQLYIQTNADDPAQVSLVTTKGSIAWSEESIADFMLSRKNQHLSVMTAEELYPVIEAYNYEKYIAPEPEEISKGEYNRLLGCLPPQRMHTYAGVTLFHISEALTGGIYMWVACLNDKHYKFYHYKNTSSDKLSAKVLLAE